MPLASLEAQIQKQGLSLGQTLSHLYLFFQNILTGSKRTWWCVSPGPSPIWAAGGCLTWALNLTATGLSSTASNSSAV